MSDHALTTQQVEDGFAHEPEYEYHNPIGYGAHVQGNRRAFRRWLAEVERAAAEKAYERGRLDERHDCNRFSEYQQGKITEEQYQRDARTRNPYRREETE